MANYGRIPGQVKQGIVAARALGARNREITARFRVSEATVTRTVREARIGELSRDLETDWSGTLIARAKRAVLEALENPEQYNRGKIGVSVLKGLGFFQAAGAKAGNTHIDGDVNITNITEPQIEELINARRKQIADGVRLGLVDAETARAVGITIDVTAEPVGENDTELQGKLQTPAEGSESAVE
jgi:hypothetical protein